MTVPSSSTLFEKVKQAETNGWPCVAIETGDASSIAELLKILEDINADVKSWPPILESKS